MDIVFVKNVFILVVGMSSFITSIVLSLVILDRVTDRYDTTGVVVGVTR